MPSSDAPAIDFHAHTMAPAYLELVRRGEVPGVRLEQEGNRAVVCIEADAPTGPVAQRLPVVLGYLDPGARLAAMDAAGSTSTLCRPFSSSTTIGSLRNLPPT